MFIRELFSERWQNGVPFDGIWSTDVSIPNIILIRETSRSWFGG